MTINRRAFLKNGSIAVAGAAVCAAAPAVAAYAPGHASNTKPHADKLQATQWAMVVDTTKLTTEADYAPLIQACHSYHNVPTIPGKNRIWWMKTDTFHHVFPEKATRWPEGRTPEALERSFGILCNHCTNPPCVRVCPTQATFKNEQGIVTMDMHRCIGCRYCMAGCPYGARSFNWEDPRPYLNEVNSEYVTRMKGVVEKCNFCAERLAFGKMPACVEASGGALTFGDLGDPESNVSKLLKKRFVLRRKPTLGTQPNVYYIV